jgi:pilus assembly protein CpaE
MAGERIVFVDDEGQIRKLVQTYLERHGYIVATATDGYEALKEIRKAKPHLVITDVSMPNLTGLELTRRLRAEAATARLPIIMLSARKQADDILAGYAQGADEYVAKPVELAVLAAKVELLLRRSRAAEPAAEGAATANGRVVVVLHAKGGAGATTLAVNGAIALASTMIYRVALLDLSLEFSGAGILLDLKPTRTLADLTNIPIPDMDDAAFDLFVSRHKSGISFVAGSDRPERAELVTVPAIQHTLDRLRRMTDYLVVDCAPTFSQQTLAAIDQADALCVVSSAGLPALKATLDLLTVLEQLAVPRERILLALDRITPAGLNVEQITRFFGRRPDVSIPYAAAFEDAANDGAPLVSSAPENASAIAIRDLAAQITVTAPARH